MFNNIFVASGNDTMRDLIMHSVKGAGVRVVAALHVADASDKRNEERFDLVIVDLNLTRDGDAKMNRKEWLGLKLLEDWYTKSFKTPSILLTEIDEAPIRTRTRALDLCEFLYVGKNAVGNFVNIPDELAELMNKLARGTPDNLGKPSATIELTACNDGRVHYVMKWRGDNCRLHPLRGTIDISLQNRQNDADIISKMRANKDRVKYLRIFGRTLFDDLFKGKCGGAYRSTLGFCWRDPSSLRIRIEMDRDVYPVAFEALCDDEYGDFLMLQAPIARRVADPRGISPLDLHERREVNVLVIISDVRPDVSISGPNDKAWQDRAATVRPEELKNLKLERKYFEALRDGGERAKLGIGEIRIVPEGVEGRGAEFSLSEEIKKLLTPDDGVTKRYDIVHFAGHSLFHDDKNDEDDRGFLLFEGRPHATAETVATFASWLAEAKTRFVYMSSCRSSTAEAAFQMARHGIPAVLGFRWDLDDARAVEFATSFYDKFFKSNFPIAEAFTKTRQELYNRYKHQNCIWAAPILIMQPEDWHEARCRADGEAE